MSEVIPLVKGLRDESHVFALLMMFLCMPLHTMWSGKSLQLKCILPFGILCLSAIRMIYKIYIGSVYVGGYGGLRKSVNCVHSAFL